MQFSAVLVAVMATFAAAAPSAEPGYGGGCTPATYDCEGKYGWRVCDTSGKWVSAGICPPKTICKYYAPSKSPYCVPPNFQFPQ
ncbi:hypothetical protein G7Z17_g7706 [Cylindrodendrum hubeiense]|uniref:Uncharacterized protein n=1 Tax=Cylindrodendrum hubeiense TaxID=595255 RepID=A0A9P5H548_9HYPO|nr:hypothetical protein G7Z17_g7706 [Cylindrodendrum hubeiense]